MLEILDLLIVDICQFFSVSSDYLWSDIVKTDVHKSLILSFGLINMSY